MGNSSTGRYAEDAEAWALPNRRRFAEAVEPPAAAAGTHRTPGMLRRLAELLAARAVGRPDVARHVPDVDPADAALARALGVRPERVAALETEVLRRVGLRRDELSVGEADRLRAVVIAESATAPDAEVVRRAIQDLARG